MCVELCPLHPIPLHILKFDFECYVLSFNVIAQRCEAAHARVAIESSTSYYHFHRPLMLFELGFYNKSRRHQPRFYYPSSSVSRNIFSVRPLTQGKVFSGHRLTGTCDRTPCRANRRTTCGEQLCTQLTSADNVEQPSAPRRLCGSYQTGSWKGVKRYAIKQLNALSLAHVETGGGGERE